MDQKNKVQLGLSGNNLFQSIGSLNTKNLQYASKSVDELLVMLREKENMQNFEQCAIIRDEIVRRMQ